MARQRFVATDEARQRVQYMAGIGLQQEHIAKIVGCAPKTLRRCFRDELDRGIAHGHALVAKCLFNLIKSGNVPATLFYLKTRMGWQENPAREVPTAKPEAPKAPQQVRLIRRSGADARP
jgi:hypothetical protein